MLTAHELFGFMSPALAHEILQCAYENDKETYRVAVNSVAEARKLRPAFYERRPKVERHKDMVAMLSKPRLDMVAATLIRAWLMTKHVAMLAGFLDSLGIPHKEGVVEDLPETMEDEKLRAAIDALLARHSPEEVAVYLNAFYSMNEVAWPNLKALLEEDSRLQIGG
jgi:hypothetical protein